MKSIVWLGCLWGFMLACEGGGEIPEQELPLIAPPGFRVTEFVTDRQAHDIFCLTFDPQGRLVVSGPGYIRVITDQDGDGVGDLVQTFADGPQSGAQGLCYEGSDLLCVGDGGLLRYQDRDGDGRADGPPELLLTLRTGGEHDAHAIQLGPDGWWYLIAGNSAQITAKYATLPTSLIKQPRAGALLRFSPDFTRGEIIAEGLRNAYDFALHSSGDVLIFDSDDEREISLPWYRPTRVFHALLGADFGWVSRGWKRPNYFPDMPPVVGNFGRGSPTGMTCYRHTQFPSEYHHAVFALDWTYGRVWCLHLVPQGETWSARVETFLRGAEGQGFAPTDCEVGPDGCLYVSVGGRGTRGAVYRVQAVSAPPNALPSSELESCLSAPQPQASWSRQRWLTQARALGREPFLEAARDSRRVAAQRVRAIEILTELFGGLDEATAVALMESKPAGDRDGHLVRARAMWAWGRTYGQQLEPALLARGLNDPHPQVVRVALEAAQYLSPERDWRPLVMPLARILGSEYRYNRHLAMKLVSRAPAALLKEISQATTQDGPRAVISYALGWLDHPQADVTRVRKAVIPLTITLLRGDYAPDLKLDALRLLQRMLGDLGASEQHSPAFDGYTPLDDLQHLERELDELRSALADVYPTQLTVVDHELSRVLAMLAPANQRLLDKILAQIREESDPVDDIHHLLVAARLPVPRSAAQRQLIAQALIHLDGKFQRRKLPQDSAWNDRLRELYIRLCELDESLAASLLDVQGFGRPAHVLFMAQMPAERLQTAIQAFVRQIQADRDYPWNNDVVFLLGASAEPSHRQLIRSLYDRFSVRGAVLMTLAEKPEEMDRPWFREGLSSSQAEVVEACLMALEKLPPDNSPEEQVALLRATRRLNGDAREYRLRERAVQLLERNTGHREPFLFGEEGYQPQAAAIAAWTRWIELRWPQASSVTASDPDVEALPRRLREVDWSRGDATRGAKLFEMRNCAQCHSGRSALGPDLSGVTSRFSRDDLFVAIVDPSRDVSARYQTTIVQTRQGRTHSGLIVYESVDGLLLRNATLQTVRVETRDIEERRKSPISLMPMGLLKDLTPADYADLYAYLATLGRNRPASAAAGSETP